MAVPGAKGLLTPTPGSLASVAANSPVAVQLAVSVPQATVAGNYSGSVQVTAQGKNVAKPLPVTIHVQTQSSVTTLLSATSVQTGGSVSDQATISNAAPTARGTITYKVYSDNNCQTQVADATPTSNTVVNAVAPASNPVTFNNAGTFYWQATYSGDPATNTLGSHSTCTDEQLTVTTPTSSCTNHGTIGCPWQNDDLTTYNQVEWGNDSTNTAAADLLTANFDSVYADSFGELVVGPGSGSFHMSFASAAAVFAYLPQTATPGALDSSLSDPTVSVSGKFGGDVVALKLNVDFADAGLLTAASGLKFGDLTICGLTSDTDLNGMTVRRFLTLANTALGAGGSTDPINPDLESVAATLNASFLDGTPSTWAQQHLENGTCGWHTGDLTTYPQSAWGNGGAASSLLQNNYATVYAPTNYLFVIGLSSGGFSAQWSDSTILGAYMPSGGSAAALTANTADATSDSSGIYGGQVAALKLNIDFSAAALLASSSGLKFGDLTICGLTSDTDLNGQTVSQFLGIANTALGGGTTTDSIADLNSLGANLDASFAAGTPSTWAQDHLVDGSCP